MANEQGQADWFGKDVPKAPEANGLSDTERAMILVGHYAGLAGAAKQALIELRKMSSKEGRPLWVKEIGFRIDFRIVDDGRVETAVHGLLEEDGVEHAARISVQAE